MAIIDDDDDDENGPFKINSVICITNGSNALQKCYILYIKLADFLKHTTSSLQVKNPPVDTYSHWDSIEHALPACLF